MKKHLLAVAVAAAVSAPVMAQNVTISGAFDIGVGSTKIDGTSRSSTISGAFATPTLKFTANEDLGGGLKVAVNIAQEFNTSNGNITGSGQTTAQTTLAQTSTAFVNGATTNAYAEDQFQEVSLQLAGAFGSVKFGQFNSTARDNAGVYRFAGEFGRLGSGYRGLGKENDNHMEYVTPTFSGVSASVSYSNGGKNHTADAGTKVIGMSAGYVSGPLNVRVSRVSSDVNATANKNTESFYGVTYDFGMAKLGVLRAVEQSEASTQVETNATIVNVAVPLGNGLTAHGSIHQYDGDAATAEADGVALSIVKDMSKRTSLYAGYQSIENSGGGTVGFGLIGKGTANKTDKAYVVGVVHKF